MPPSNNQNRQVRQFSLRSEDNVYVDPDETMDNVLFSSTTSLNTNNGSKYSMNYRVVKTALLVSAWIAFGLNFEMIGPTFEDLRNHLGVNYSQISLGLALRNFGYLGLSLLFGLVFDRIAHLSELMMAVASIIMGISNFLMPISRVFLLELFYFFAQGAAQAIYDLAGNHIILKLWQGVSTSPINAMHAGYGIGAILAIQVAKPFITFDPYKHQIYHLNKQTPLPEMNMSYSTIINESLTTSAVASSQESTLSLNLTTIVMITTDLTSNASSVSGLSLNPINDDLKIPYWIAGAVAMTLAILFGLAQHFEMQVAKIRYRKQLVLQAEEIDLDNRSLDSAVNSVQSMPVKHHSISYRLFFGDRVADKRLIIYLSIQTALFVVMFMFSQGYFTILTRFMLTYLTLGPAKINVDSFVAIQSLFWSFFIFGRFGAAYVAFKSNSAKFFLGLLVLNLLFGSLFLIPFFTQFKTFFWIGVSLLGLSSGPMMPTGIAIAKEMLDFTSFVLSLFIVGMGLGGIIFQQTTGSLLDHFKPGDNWLGFDDPNSAYIIPYISIIPSALCLVVFIPIIFLYSKRAAFIRK